MKIITIDPSMNGATAILVAKINPAEEEQITITDFAIVDFRATETTDSEFIKEIRYRQLEEVINFIIKERPYGVIMENFIMFRQQMGAWGQAFITSEMIGAIDLEMRRNFIPVIKPRSSDLYSRTGYGKRELKVGLSNWHLLNRGLLGKIGNALALNVNGTLYKLKDFQVGSKNDHIIMALRHLINELELKNSDLGKRLLSAKRRFDWEPN